MAGLVLGIRTYAGSAPAASPPGDPTRYVRLVALQGPAVAPPARRQSGYALGPTVPDSISVPGPTILMTRGETTAVTVVNRGEEHTTVHWHGMELESIYDGVAGWSGADGNMAPLIAPGDSFTVAFTPPRAGTYMYHSHMDEAGEVRSGSYGPLLVLEPGQTHDPATDLLFMAGSTVSVRSEATVNGSIAPADRVLRVGTTYRIRLMSVLPAEVLRVTLSADSTILSWLAVAKDGADLPAPLRVEVPASELPLGTGETYDFLWTPAARMNAVLSFRPPFGQEPIRQRLIVR
jgi:FtsP/CotA-like multicopper oxidase with cupredoxin domain